MMITNPARNDDERKEQLTFKLCGPRLKVDRAFEFVAACIARPSVTHATLVNVFRPIRREKSIAALCTGEEEVGMIGPPGSEAIGFHFLAPPTGLRLTAQSYCQA